MAEVLAKIAASQELWSRLRPRALADSRFVQRLRSYGRESKRSAALMSALRVGEQCARCSKERIAGGCCSPAVEGWYSEPLLILNLALGVRFPSRRHFQEGCLFLGPKGCILAARHDFCVNYLCSHLEAWLGPAGTALLRRQYGKELALGWELEVMVHRFLEALDG